LHVAIFGSVARRWRLVNETLEKKHKQNGISATTTATTTATIATTTYCRSRTIGFFSGLPSSLEQVKNALKAKKENYRWLSCSVFGVWYAAIV